VGFQDAGGLQADPAAYAEPGLLRSGGTPIIRFNREIIMPYPNPTKRSSRSLVRGAFCAPFLLTSATLLAESPAAAPAAPAGHDMAHMEQWKNSPLVRRVRNATARFHDINVAIADGWVQGTPCVSGPNSGAMGVHFVKPERLADGVLNATEPEALIYEPLPGGRFRLVGVEFITIASAWDEHNPGAGAPQLEGHLLNYVSEPNRYGLPAFYEIHVWGWERNPNGSFADWNSVVSCEKQPLS
jgi:hypothetical protein